MAKIRLIPQTREFYLLFDRAALAGAAQAATDARMADEQGA